VKGVEAVLNHMISTGGEGTSTNNSKRSPDGAKRHRGSPFEHTCIGRSAPAGSDNRVASRAPNAVRRETHAQAGM
jgi:hypothetical protein